MAWLVREGDVLASAEVAHGVRERTAGLLGRDPASVTGALVIRPCRQIHTLASDFDPEILSSQVLQQAVRSQAAEVAGAIDAPVAGG